MAAGSFEFRVFEASIDRSIVITSYSIHYTKLYDENTYPPIPAEAGRLGARFFINITSEGLVGGPIQEQLLRICILRAVENGIPYVRAGNTGISGFIDAEGRVRSVLRGRRGGSIGDSYNFV